LTQKKLFAVVETGVLYREGVGIWQIVDETLQRARIAEVSTTEVASRDR
jgi:hypothetical protein